MLHAGMVDAFVFLRGGGRCHAPRDNEKIPSLVRRPPLILGAHSLDRATDFRRCGAVSGSETKAERAAVVERAPHGARTSVAEAASETRGASRYIAELRSQSSTGFVLPTAIVAASTMLPNAPSPARSASAQINASRYFSANSTQRLTH